MSNMLVWIDLEMSGLEPEKDRILEIATIVTDSNLTILAEGPNLAVKQDHALLSGMDDWNQTHHAASGLLNRVAQSTDDEASAERKTLDFLSAYGKAGVIPLSGNSVWQDRRFLRKYMPALEAFFHYRIVDVSSIKELVKRWYPTLPAFQKKEAHLALTDIRESIAELKYYRETLFRAEPNIANLP